MIAMRRDNSMCSIICVRRPVTEDITGLSSASVKTILLQRGGVSFAWNVQAGQAKDAGLLSTQLLQEPLVAIKVLKGVLSMATVCEAREVN